MPPEGRLLVRVRGEAWESRGDERLQAALEELRRCKQELASVCMELDLVGEESERRLAALRRAAREADDLLSETDVAVLVLDRALRILHFTPPARALFNLRAGDRGRPLGDLTHRLPALELADLERACASGAVLERELVCAAGRRWLMRARSKPARRVVITFVDVTAVRSEAP
ncbi:MAG: PAS domain-containing protein [Deltaproteobacteria bacterium]|nr:PAS domain-containing protein [Deltaproteobacteria bacterium]